MPSSSVVTKSTGPLSPSLRRRPLSHSSGIHTQPEQRSDSGSMSPTIRRTEKWLQEHTPSKHNSGMDLRKVKDGKIVKRDRPDQRKKRASFWNLAFWFSGSGESQGDDNDGEDLDGDTMVDDAGSAVAPEDDTDPTLVVDDHDERVKGDKTAHVLESNNNIYLNYDDARIQEWTEEERWLFVKLTLRGHEPLLHSTWIMDYATFPDQLFTNDEKQVYINNTHTSTGRACRSLTDLIMAGSRVRDQILTDAATEKPLFHAINKYYKWSIADANVQRKDFIPVIAIASAKGQESVESVVGRLTDQLHSLSRQHRDRWRDPAFRASDDEEDQEFTRELPTLTGFVIKYSVVAIVTCDSRVPGNPIRTLGTFDFKSIGQDVWHALAVSIAMIRGRNYLMELDAEGALGPKVVEDDSDPDA